MNPPSCFRYSDHRKDLLTCLRCDKTSAAILLFNPANDFYHDCTNTNYYRPKTSSVRLRKENNVVHLFSSKYHNFVDKTNNME